KIERAWATSFGKRSIVGRLSDYLSFYVGATWKLLRVERHDILLALTQPPLIGLIGVLVGRLRGMRVVALVQDVYPDVAIAVGTLKGRSLGARFFDWLNRRALCGMDRIIVLGECMRDRIRAKVGDERSVPIDIIHNWADGQLIKPLARDEANPFRLQHNLQGKFVVLFSGNFGLVNEFQTVLEAARQLRERTDIIFLFIGEGVKGAEIRKFAEQHQLENIRMMPYQPRAELCFSLTAGDAHLTTLADGLAGLSVPSKTYAIMASGRPVLFVGDLQSAIAKLVAENDCGAVVASGESSRLAQVIIDWAADREKLDELGARARSLFETRFERQHAIDAYLSSFEKCMDDETSRLKGRLVSGTAN
ncbi:MAG TPA: glycosyltransferase family 4 protein, partial [Pyrinomonadaceae bacterium]|nr:glycosyltransferase family 4 protein [Pyrinomonadaceae bacterium]